MSKKQTRESNPAYIKLVEHMAELREKIEKSLASGNYSGAMVSYLDYNKYNDMRLELYFKE